MKSILFSLFLWFCALPAMAALDPAVVKQLAADESDDKIAAIQKLAASADKDAARVLKALSEDALFVSGDKVFLLDGEKPVDAASGALIQPAPESYDAITINNRIRSELSNAIAALRLFNPDRAVRLAAAQELQSNAGIELVPVLARALAKEGDPEIKALLKLAHAQSSLGSPDAGLRLVAVEALADSASANAKICCCRCSMRITSRTKGCARRQKLRSRRLNRAWHWAKPWARYSPASRSAASCCWRRWASPSLTA